MRGKIYTSAFGRRYEKIKVHSWSVVKVQILNWLSLLHDRIVTSYNSLPECQCIVNFRPTNHKIADQLNIQSCVLIGWSWRSKISIALAFRKTVVRKYNCTYLRWNWVTNRSESRSRLWNMNSVWLYDRLRHGNRFRGRPYMTSTLFPYFLSPASSRFYIYVLSLFPQFLTPTPLKDDDVIFGWPLM